ncbi:hypothetical protein C2S53_004267 [Perilla frutescens var. hirtella]|uniref:Uncharacterized protein n=1 Tax=Perilla frutescens var. hirtella TaxID=608512 RepID=A0AAD4INJ9_PERFH|nr:hypothetical protein C2S53_004267 [Perilla frutescens var. hirtella]
MAVYPNFLAPFITLILLLALPIPSHQINLHNPTISAAPAVLPDPPLPPYTELSPDITPLLPSPSGAGGSPAGSSMPTIPSTRSPNPDTLDAVGPDTAFAPSGSLQESSAVKVSINGLKSEFFSSCFVSWLMMMFMI